MGHQRFCDNLANYKPPSGAQVLEQMKNIEFTLGKMSGQATGVPKYTRKKRSIFFELPY